MSILLKLLDGYSFLSSQVLEEGKNPSSGFPALLHLLVWSIMSVLCIRSSSVLLLPSFYVEILHHEEWLAIEQVSIAG